CSARLVPSKATCTTPSPSSGCPPEPNSPPPPLSEEPSITPKHETAAPDRRLGWATRPCTCAPERRRQRRLERARTRQSVRLWLRERDQRATRPPAPHLPVRAPRWRGRRAERATLP